MYKSLILWFFKFQKGNSVDLNYSGVNFSSVIFFDKTTLHSMLIVCGDVMNFKNIAVKSMGEAMFNLLSLYYVFDHNYPAVYGILLLLERYCLCNKGSGVRGKKGDPSSWRKFTNNFESFLVSIPKQTV